MRSLDSTGLAEGPDGTYDPDEVGGLDEPVRRFFGAAIAPGTPRWRSVQLRMRGSIRVGRWVAFRARERLAPRHGFVWQARAGGVVSGSDAFVDGVGAMRWKLLGIVPVMDAAGKDVSRSAAGRAGGEALWLPTALLPCFGTTWQAVDDHHITASFTVDDTPIELRHTIDDLGAVTDVVFDRWGDPGDSGVFAWHPFGGTVTARATFDGMNIPVAGALGWGFGTDAWPDGEFFRYRLTGVAPVDDDARRSGD